ncbi:hypothetical protein LOK49_LG14G00789 [Camellia lanceoleosa]|uniref:Uncharacterized protein n=1 Tax=Camellia lanceoleosa TaxID=1840588 RepID=A0ACC0F9U3_9ERIC|nr:hypothetical protein LOK49_LG14G00789 [Camellia lanceoleosa]
MKAAHFAKLLILYPDCLLKVDVYIIPLPVHDVLRPILRAGSVYIYIYVHS